MSIRHETASICVLDDRERKVLLVWHKAEARWVFPGGHVEPDETLRDAALRELAEETGVELWPYLSADVRLVESMTYNAPPKPDRPGKPAEAAHLHDDTLFLAYADSRKPTKAALDEVSEVRWVELDAFTSAFPDRIRADVFRVLADLGRL